jgi:plasmid stabilization system protein ParE
MYPIQLSEKARENLEKSIDWYNEKSKGLGSRFFDDFESSLKTIQRTPKGFRERFENVRALKLKRFPFLVLYVLTQGRIDVINIFHTSRDPETWEE